MESRKAPVLGSEAHTITGSQFLSQMQEQFIREGVPSNILVDYERELIYERFLRENSPEETIRGLNPIQLRIYTVDVLNDLHGTINRHQYQSLSAEQQRIVAVRIEDTCKVINELGVSFNDLKALPTSVLRQVISNYSDIYRICVEYEFTTFNELISLDPEVRDNLLENSIRILTLIDPEIHKMQFKDFIHLKSAVQKEFFENPYKALNLLELMPFRKIKILRTEVVKLLLKHSDACETLANANIPFEIYNKYGINFLNKMLHSAKAVTTLTASGITIDNLYKLNNKKPALVNTILLNYRIYSHLKSSGASFLIFAT